MPLESVMILSLLIFIVAILYSSVGHAGASGYLAVMTLFNLGPDSMKPIALILNIGVSVLAFLQFYRAGYFVWSLFWPFAALSLPCAFWGGFLALPTHAFKITIGFVLLFSAFRFAFPTAEETVNKPPSIKLALPLGAGLGLMSGLTGTGGGIFLTPLLLLKRWANAKTAAAVSALFILMNSLAGLAGNFVKTLHLPSFAFIFVVAALSGGAIGSYYGSKKFNHRVIKRILAVVLTIAGTKLVLTL